ncbi:MAG: hypothetical protein K5930_03535 [Treponemataceae bacterium]|nr:hypothetical protein [Treponemataceae bacterium]
MRQNAFIKFFFPSEEIFEKLTTSEKGQLPVIIYGNIIFLFGFGTLSLTQILRNTYTMLAITSISLLVFITACIMLRKSKLHTAVTLDTVGMLVATAGILFFMGMGTSPLEIYRSACFVVVMAIFNQLFATRSYHVWLYATGASILLIIMLIMEFFALRETNLLETLTAIVISAIATISSFYGLVFLWKQNKIITNEAIMGEQKAASSLKTIKAVLSKSFEGLEIGKKLNDEVHNVNTGIADIDELYSYLAKESETLTKHTIVVTESSSQIMEQTSKMQDTVYKQNRSIDITSSEINQIAQKLNSIAEIAEKRKSKMSEMTKMVGLQLQQIKKLAQDVSLVQESSNSIRDFVDTVNQIAAHTGLLAMNASIEAAHAGSMGKGFSVIAQEIRKLSDETTKNATQITDKLNENAELVESATASANNCADYTSKSNEEIFSTVEAIEEILGGISEVSKSTTEITSSLQGLQKDASYTNSFVKKSVDEINRQNETIQSISSFSNMLKTRVDSLDDVLRNIKKSMNNVNEVAEKNVETSTTIAKTLASEK